MEICLSVVFGYLLGSIPSAVLIARLRGFADPRSAGSGNPGTSNSIRLMGFKWGALVFLMDFLKAVAGVLCALLVHFLCLQFVAASFETAFISQACAAVAVLLGHRFPVFARFKGGKGVASGAGLMLLLYPESFIFSLILFVLILFSTGYVSLASISAAVLLPLSYILIKLFQNSTQFLQSPEDFFALGLSIFIAAFVLVSHRQNLGRLLKGTENRFEKVRILKLGKKR